MPGVWRPVRILMYPFNPSSSCWLLPSVSQVGVCVNVPLAAPRRHNPSLAPKAFVCTCLLSFEEIVPPLLWKLHPSANHVWYCRLGLANCSMSPSLVIPCMLTGPITSAVPGVALQVSTHLIYYIHVPGSHEGPPPLGLGMLFWNTSILEMHKHLLAPYLK